jgi:DMSO/TMAO reductase YedYZ molybdopterin-dependent catalytic subunit
MVSDPTLTVVCTGHCVGIGRMMRGLGGAALVGGC